MKRLCRILILVVTGAVTGLGGLTGQPDWDQPAAARYLDDRIDLWLARATQLQTGDRKLACISCHTVVPYLWVRPALRKAMQVTKPTPQEEQLLDHVARRVGAALNRACMSDPEHGGQHGTEEVLNALVLARHDADEGRPQASEATRQAFRQLWETQRADGAWDWMDFAQEPDESAGARYYGAALAALAVGTAPAFGGGSEGYSTAAVGRLRGYLRDNLHQQNLYNRIWLLSASARWPGLLTQAESDALIGELKGRQNQDGGWSLYHLGPWRGSEAKPPAGSTRGPEPRSPEPSDGYATGLIVYTLLQVGMPASDAGLARATNWLKRHQQEIQVDPYRWKCWQTPSLNHGTEPGTAHGQTWERMMMSDLATAFATLALVSVEQGIGQ